MKNLMNETYLKVMLALFAPPSSEDYSERGDVPGWVMITMMT